MRDFAGSQGFIWGLMMKRIYQARDGAEAHFIKGLLEQAGIPAVVMGEMLHMGVGQVPFTEAYPTVCVREEDATAAEAVLAGSGDRVTEARGEPWTCPVCGESIEPQFTECWACAARLPDVVPDGVQCLACGYDLRQLDAHGACPECGQAIEASLAMPHEAARRELHLYGHDECSLCDRLEAMVRPILQRGGATLVKHDITTRQVWEIRYGKRIPVLTNADGRVLLEGRPTLEQVTSELAAFLQRLRV